MFMPYMDAFQVSHSVKQLCTYVPALYDALELSITCFRVVELHFYTSSYLMHFYDHHFIPCVPLYGYEGLIGPPHAKYHTYRAHVAAAAP